MSDSHCPRCHTERRVYATGRASLYKCRACGFIGVKHTFWPELLGQRPSLHWEEVTRPIQDGHVLKALIDPGDAT